MTPVRPECLPSGIAAAVKKATGSVAPCWPLKDFVAVNPFLGMAGYQFHEAAHRMARVAGARLYMPRQFYAEAIASGRIRTEDLEAALTARPDAARAVGDLHALRRATLDPQGDKAPALLPTVADVAKNITGTNWAGFVEERVSRWAAAYFDQAQASWVSPWRHQSPYVAWRAEARIDRTPDVAGLHGFRGAVALLPESADELIEHAVERLGVVTPGLECYFHRLLMAHGGWSAHARYQDWQRTLSGKKEAILKEFLAVRLGWELALFHTLEHHGIARAWAVARDSFVSSSSNHETAFAVESLLHHAYEHAWQRELIASFSLQTSSKPSPRAAVQAVFCIDVRSEVYRRCLEASAEGLETLGLAGFFGVPMAYLPLAHGTAQAQCPALIAPRYVLREGALHPEVEKDLESRRRVWYRVAEAWRSFKYGAVASFGFVETLGLAFGAKLLTDSLGLTRPVPHPAEAGFAAGSRHARVPSLVRETWNGMEVGLAIESRVEIASTAFKGMSLHESIAPLVLLVGHGSTSVNNPHAAGLDCGACGGHAGDVNARVMAMIFNDPEVRLRLAEKGISIPADTVFVAALHDTTSDAVTLFDEYCVPATHEAALKKLKASLDQASKQARTIRAGALHENGKASQDTALIARGRDWSQIRPEWGLAGCAAFIAAPRHRTRHLNLDGRAFLHDYDWSQDQDSGVLELVMTAPLVVASWINLQYFGSTVDNRVFGSGDKTLHNVVGTLGVLEGSGGDLRVGLPWQSLHDGERLIHEPMRLAALIEAPVQAMNEVIARHEHLRVLLDNNWLHLYAIDERGAVQRRYNGGGHWVEVKTGERPRVVAA